MSAAESAAGRWASPGLRPSITDFCQLSARARVMGSYAEIVAKPNIWVTEMPYNAVAVLLRSGRDQPSSWARWAFRREPAAPLTRHHPHDTRRSGSGLGAAPRSEFCASKAALCATGRARTSCDANAVPDRSVQSMRVQFSGSVQRSSLNKFHVCAQTFLFEM